MEKFSTSFRGYNKEEVNKFVADCIKQVEEMLDNLKSKDTELAKLNSDLEKYRTLEESLRKALVMAEDTSSQMRKMASSEGERIISDAKRNASRIVNEALLEAERTQQESMILKRNIIAFKRRLKSILENQLEMVDDIDHLDT